MRDIYNYHLIHSIIMSLYSYHKIYLPIHLSNYY